MEALFELIFGRLITYYLGLNTRYYFFKLFNHNLKKEDIEGGNNDRLSDLGQGFYNSIIGLIIFFILSFVIVYILDMVGVLK